MKAADLQNRLLRLVAQVLRPVRQLKKSMARNYLERLARQNTNIYGTFNPSKMVDEINRLGTTGEVLFGKQHKALMNGLADLGTVNPRIADDELARMAEACLWQIKLLVLKVF